MQNTISFNTKFGWISATELNNKISCIRFQKKNGMANHQKTLNSKKDIL